MQLNQEIVTMLALPDIRQRLASFDLEPVGSSPEQMASHLKAEVGKWGEGRARREAYAQDGALSRNGRSDPRDGAT